MKILELKELISKFNDYDEVDILDCYGTSAQITDVIQYYPNCKPTDPNKINIFVIANFQRVSDLSAYEIVGK
jgi:hypothetical protein